MILKASLFFHKFRPNFIDMRIHFIAVGGAIMHNLAIALHKQGHIITGSDDEIFDPARSNLEKYGLLPDVEGWKAERINADLDIIILGMHARPDNPELERGRSLGIKIYSFPEFMYEQTRNKKRIVIGGSHGKTTTTAMIMHVLKDLDIPHDYLVGSSLEGYETMVGFSDDSKVAIFEGDEYLTSPLDPRPKFHLYKPHLALVTGVAWDHVNVFPTWDFYKKQFEIFAGMIEEGGSFIYFDGDEVLRDISSKLREDIEAVPYNCVKAEISEGQTYIIEEGRTMIPFFGKHNLQNMAGAWEVCKRLNISKLDFLSAIQSFTGAGKRLEKIYSDDSKIVFRDFAHAPSKVRATVQAVKEQYPDKKLYACLELHTFSSLNKEFLPQYSGAMDKADEAVVFFNPDVVKHKKLPEITSADIMQSFNREDLKVYSDAKDLQSWVSGVNTKEGIVLMMSSGNFGGVEIK